jgi:hypothetical protein
VSGNDNQSAQREALRKPIEAATRRAIRDIDYATGQVDLSWQAGAACRDVPASTADAMSGARSAEEADLLVWRCDGCSVAYECLTAGLHARGDGIWGGFVLADGREAGDPPRRASKPGSAARGAATHLGDEVAA